MRVRLAILAVALPTLAAAAYFWYFASLTVDQRTAASATWFSFGSFAVAVVVGLGALPSYRNTRRKPNLRLRVSTTQRNRDFLYEFELHNSGDASAVHAVAWIVLPGEAEARRSARWMPDGYQRLRWEAPAGAVMHSKVPPYRLPALRIAPHISPVTVIYTLVADGFGPFQGEVTAYPPHAPLLPTPRSA